MENNINDLVGYCTECKDPVLIDEDYVKDRGKLYCTYCYKAVNNIVEELEFDR